MSPADMQQSSRWRSDREYAGYAAELEDGVVTMGPAAMQQSWKTVA